MSTESSKLIGVLVFLSILRLLTGLVSADEGERVLTLDHSNFTEIISHHNFIVVEFYAPWCWHCNNLAPEYEKAATILSSHDPPLALAKVDANDEANKELAETFKIQGFPTIKILRNGGKHSQEYNGPREADGIVSYLKKQFGPASPEIRSTEDVSTLIDEKKVSVVGIFPKFSGEEFENYTVLAEKMRSDYDFGHTLDAKLLPQGESLINRPTLRLLKPFDELFVDFQDFQVDAMEKFIEEASVPIVTEYNNDKNNYPFIVKFFNSPNAKAMLFVNFSSKHSDAFKSIYGDVAKTYKGEGISFLLGDVEPSQRVLEYLGLKNDQTPVVFIKNNNGQKYMKQNLEPHHIGPWIKQYRDGELRPFVKSDPIPEVNNEPVKVVVADSLQDMIFNSRKNILLEFYAPGCPHCIRLAPILDEVAVSFANDEDVVIAKLDATANDFPTGVFDVKGFPTLYFKSATDHLLQYDGGRTKEEIIEFIQKNRDEIAQSSTSESAPAKDEL